MLNLATQSKSPAHYAKGTQLRIPSKLGLALPQLVGYTVSRSFHFPNGGTFHLSFTVLLHYRLPESI